REIDLRKTLQKKAEEEEEKFKNYCDTVGAIILAIDKEGKVKLINKKGCEILGLPKDKIIGKRWSDHFIPQEVREEVENVFKNLLEGKEKEYEYFENPVLTKTGEKRIILWHNRVLREKDGKVKEIISSGEDITEQKRMQETLERERNIFEQLINNIPESVYFKDKNGRFTKINQAKAQHAGLSTEEMIGKTDFDLYPEEQARKMWEDDLKVMRSKRPIINKVEEATHTPGEKRWVSVTKLPLFDEKGNVAGIMGISRDITEQKRKEDKLSYMATHDLLTGLPNRVLFADRLDVAIFRAKRNGEKFFLMLLDLDDFKKVNDSLGHSAGDMLLKKVAEKLKNTLRKTDTVARMGGDEFLILLPDTRTREAAELVAKKILSLFNQPFLIDSHKINITPSIGIVAFPDDGEDKDTLIKKADIAMYKAKAEGKANYRYYKNSHQETSEKV
ncbi:diguanylate cyclase, partial [Candidatus Aerophobetes bacterium]|nr:diguanylate cyclase [Candidatus Aerophobetes bacterium]